jgi:LPXTG-motif cell wall-anchored protein
MLIEEGDRFRGVPRSELPAVPPPEAPRPVQEASSAPEGLGDEGSLILILAGLLVGLGLVLFFVMRAKKKRSE